MDCLAENIKWYVSNNNGSYNPFDTCILNVNDNSSRSINCNDTGHSGVHIGDDNKKISNNEDDNDNDFHKNCELQHNG